MANTQIIEMNGVKLEVDFREAKTIDTVKVGDKVKLLKKNYSDSYTVHAGVIVGFEPFPDKPAIVVAYVEINYSSVDLKVETITVDTKNVQIVKSVDDVPFHKDDALKLFQRQIATKEAEIETIREKMAYFERNFGVYWQSVVPVKSAS